MKIMLIGGTGVLSKDVARECLKSGYELYMVNRGKRRNFIPKNVTLIVGDVSKPQDLIKRIEGMEFDVVVDFLSYESTQLSKTLGLFKDKCKQFIFISSATVYSKDNEDEPITEDKAKTNTQWSYSKNKIECEDLLTKFFVDKAVHYTIVRPYITYGNTRIPFALISPLKQWTLVDRILKNKPVIIWDDGSAKCTLTHTEDFAKAMVGLFLNEKAYGEEFHITSDEQQSWKDVIKMVGRTLEHDVKLISVPSDIVEKHMANMKGELTEDKAHSRLFDNSKIKSAVEGFECSISFENGIKDTVEFYKTNKEMQKIDVLWNYKIEIMVREAMIRNGCQGFGRRIINQCGIVTYKVLILFNRVYQKTVRVFRKLFNK